MKKIVILNDTTRDAGHWGCSLVMNNLVRLCEASGYDDIYRDKDCRRNFNIFEFREKIQSADIVLLNGEGTLHDNAGAVWFEKARMAAEMRKKVFLVNSVWQNNPETKKYLDVFAAACFRESLSYEEARRDGAENAYPVPDLSFYSTDIFRNAAKNFPKERKRVLMVDSTVRKITEKMIDYAYKKQIDMVFMYEKNRRRWSKKWWYRWKNFYYGRCFELFETPQQLEAYSHLVSGRYHACCLAMMCGCPCLAVSSNTWKTEGMYKDAGIEVERYVLADFTDKDDRLGRFFEEKHSELRETALSYATEAPKKIEAFYKDIL